MGELTAATKAFLDALSLEPGTQDEFEFGTVKEADSFRVALYTIKRKMNDNTVLISVNGKVISLLKKDEVIKRRRISASGEVIEIEEKEREMSDFEKKVNEIIEDAEGFESEEKRKLFISEAIAELTFRESTAKLLRAKAKNDQLRSRRN